MRRLVLQGMPESDSQPIELTDCDLRHLAGNAMPCPVIGAIICLAKVLTPAKEGGNKAHDVGERVGLGNLAWLKKSKNVSNLHSTRFDRLPPFGGLLPKGCKRLHRVSRRRNCGPVQAVSPTTDAASSQGNVCMQGLSVDAPPATECSTPVPHQRFVAKLGGCALRGTPVQALWPTSQHKDKQVECKEGEEAQEGENKAKAKGAACMQGLFADAPPAPECSTPVPHQRFVAKLGGRALGGAPVQAPWPTSQHKGKQVECKEGEEVQEGENKAKAKAAEEHKKEIQ